MMINGREDGRQLDTSSNFLYWIVFMSKELVKTIDGYDGMYLININGEVFSKYRGITLKPSLYHGYLRVILYDKKNKKQQSHYIHRLIAEYFIPNPNCFPCVNHKDENKLNNSVDNLEWCTIKYNNTYNNIHKIRGKKVSEAIKRKGGAHNKGTQMTEEQKRKISKKMTGKPFRGNQYVSIKW